MKSPMHKTTDNQVPGAILLSLLVCVLFLMPVAGWASTIRVTWDPERVKHGGVVPLRVQSPIKLLAAEAATERDRFPLIPMGGGEYIALVGIETHSKKSSMPVDFALFPAKGGAPYRIRADLVVRTVKAAESEVQKLTLPTGMVDFSREKLEQVHSDSKTLVDSLGTRSRDRFWETGFLLPVAGRITTRFGVRRILNGKPRSPHSGVDIAAKKGTQVIVSNSGKVLLADSFYLSGNTVVVDHGWGVLTVYAHLDRINVTEGQFVEQSQTIGTVGATGRATGPHLHFDTFIRGVKVDPLQLIEVTRGF